MKKRSSTAVVRRVNDRLAALRPDPGQQQTFAAEVLTSDPPLEVLSSLVAALGEPIDEALRPTLLALYAELDGWEPRHDLDGPIRGALLRAVATVALPADREVFLDALHHVEDVPPTPVLGPTQLRAAGIRGLQRAAPEEARFHALNLLFEDPTRQGKTGEPHLSAVAVLEELHDESGLYAFVASGHGVPLARGNAIRALKNLPQGVIDECILKQETANLWDGAGWIDVALAASPRVATETLVREILSSKEYDLVEYAALGIAAIRHPEWLAVLYDRARGETLDTRMLIFIRALQAVPGDPRTDAALALALQRRATLLSPNVQNASSSDDSETDSDHQDAIHV